MKRTGGGILVALGLALMLFGGYAGLRPHLFRETVKVVFLLDPADPNQQAAHEGFRLALEEADGRAGRFQVAHETLDSTQIWTSHPIAGISLIMGALDDEDVMAVVAAPGRADLSELAGPANAERILLVSAGAAEAALTRPNDEYLDHPDGLRPSGTVNYFGLFAPDIVISRRVERWMKRRGVRTVLMVGDRDGRQLEYFVFGMDALGQGTLESVGDLIEGKPFFDRPESVKRVVEMNVDLFYGGFASPKDMGLLVRLFREEGFQGDILCSETALNSDYLAAAGPHAEGVHFMTSFLPYEPGFDKQFRARFGESPRPQAYGGYLAGRYLFEAISRADRKDRETIRDAFSRLAFFNEHGEPAVPIVSLYVVKNGKFEFVEELKE